MIQKNIRKVFKMNENEGVNYYNLWDAAKVRLSGKFMAVNTCVKII